MSKCTNCSNDLSRNTKGTLCIMCYRNRNKDTNNVNDDLGNQVQLNQSSNRLNVSNESVEIPEVKEDIDSLNNSLNGDDRSIIDLIKANMIQQRRQHEELTIALKNQITFMKG